MSDIKSLKEREVRKKSNDYHPEKDEESISN